MEDKKLVPVAFLVIPFPEALVSRINLALNIVFLESSYAKMYARLEGKYEKGGAVKCISL